jgi:hypothetical protein
MQIVLKHGGGIHCTHLALGPGGGGRREGRAVGALARGLQHGLPLLVVLGLVRQGAGRPPPPGGDGVIVRHCRAGKGREWQGRTSQGDRYTHSIA